MTQEEVLGNIKLKEFGEEMANILSICLDIDTPEETRIYLRNELRALKAEIDIWIAELQ